MDLLQSPNFYVHVPSRTDPTAAPADGDSIMVLLPVANMQEAGTGGEQHMLDPACSAFGQCCACAPPLQFKCKLVDKVLILRVYGSFGCSRSLKRVQCQVRGFDLFADDYSALVNAGRRAILQTFAAAGIGDMQPHIQHEEVTSPPEV